MANKRTGRGTVLFGLFVLLAGLAGAVVLFVLAQRRDDDAIRDLARAPVGCDTVMSFSDTGTFYVYIEHLGTLETIDGDCDTTRTSTRATPTTSRRSRSRCADRGRQPTSSSTVSTPEFTYSLDDSFAGTATATVRDRTDRRLRGDGRVARRRRLRRRRRTRSRRRRRHDAASARSRRASPASCSDSASSWWASAAVGGRGAWRRRTPPTRVADRSAVGDRASDDAAATHRPMPPPHVRRVGDRSMPVGPPVGRPPTTQPAGHGAVDPAPGPMAPPRVFAPPGMPIACRPHRARARARRRSAGAALRLHRRDPGR